jgi:ribosomal protein L40E
MPTTDPETAIMICPKCGAKQPKHETCRHCGVFIAKAKPNLKLPTPAAPPSTLDISALDSDPSPHNVTTARPSFWRASLDPGPIFVMLGILIAGWGFLQYFTAKNVTGALQQQIQETWFLQGIAGLMLTGLGSLISAVRSFSKRVP